MATTTNYSWTTPDDTALVKDGAAAIRTLGSSIDTTTKNLNPQTTTGAIAFRSATSNVNTSLAIGTAGQVLTVNSGATAPEWATPTSGGMTQLATGSLSGSQVNLTSISGSYKNLQLVIKNYRPTTDGRSLRARFNADSGSNYNSNDIDAAPIVDSAYGTDLFTIAPATDSTTNNGLTVWDIFDYANTSTWKLSTSKCLNSGNTTPTAVTNTKIDQFYGSTSAITEINLFPSSGTFTAGTYILYGVK